MNIEQMDNEVVESLHGREFVNEEIECMTADQAFDEYCLWNGLIGWGPKLRRVLDQLREQSPT